MQHMKKTLARVYYSRLKRALRYARAMTARYNKCGPDKRFLKLRDHFDEARQKLCALQYSPLLSTYEKSGLMSCVMGLSALVEQIEAKVIHDY